MSSALPATNGNFAQLLLRHAADPDRCETPAVVLPTRWTHARVLACDTLTFRSFGDRVADICHGINAAGLAPGERVVLLFPLSSELYCLTTALWACGLAVVLVDAGMGRQAMLRAIAAARPTAIVSMRAVLRYHALLPPLWRLRKFCIDGRGGLFVRPYARLVGDAKGSAAKVLPRHASDHALITFTSGTTGHPKGADRNHGLVAAQHQALADAYPMHAGAVHMTCFPVVALHNMACGVTTILPAGDLAKPGLAAPGQVQPAVVAAQLRDHAVTHLTCAPAFMQRLATHIADSGLTLPALARVGVGGAPVSSEVCRVVLRAFPHAECEVVYGSTEAEPICSVAMAEVAAAHRQGGGFLVGRPRPIATTVLLNLRERLAQLDERGVRPFMVKSGEIGEVVVSGPHVNRHYLDNPAADAENKLYTPDGTAWHRTGDLAYEDEAGRLWLVGRTPDVVQHAGRAVLPFPIEEHVDAIDGVRRCALVAHAKAPGGELAVEIESVLGVSHAPAPVGAPTTPAQASEHASEHAEETPGAADVLARVRTTLSTHGLGAVPIRVVPRIPVDRRHNSKIDRPSLRRQLEG